jgi:hypothetical protein
MFHDTTRPKPNPFSAGKTGKHRGKQGLAQAEFSAGKTASNREQKGFIPGWTCGWHGVVIVFTVFSSMPELQ